MARLASDHLRSEASARRYRRKIPADVEDGEMLVVNGAASGVQAVRARDPQDVHLEQVYSRARMRSSTGPRLSAQEIALARTRSSVGATTCPVPDSAGGHRRTPESGSRSRSDHPPHYVGRTFISERGIRQLGVKLKHNPFGLVTGKRSSSSTIIVRGIRASEVRCCARRCARSQMRIAPRRGTVLSASTRRSRQLLAAQMGDGNDRLHQADSLAFSDEGLYRALGSDG